MRFLITLTAFLLLFFSGCSPKYKVVKEYHSQNINKSCINGCQMKLNECKQNCQAKFSTCKIEADKVAMQNYNQKMEAYHKALENYADAVQRYNLDMELEFAFYDDPFCYGRSPFYHRPFFYDPFWRTPSYYLPPRPKKPSLEQEKLKVEAKMCDLDCDCGKKYDLCFSGCGGEIVNRKICIENCPSER